MRKVSVRELVRVGGVMFTAEVAKEVVDAEINVYQDLYVLKKGAIEPAVLYRACVRARPWNDESIWRAYVDSLVLHLQSTNAGSRMEDMP